MVTTARHMDTEGARQKEDRRKESREEMVTTARHLHTEGARQREDREEQERKQRGDGDYSLTPAH